MTTGRTRSGRYANVCHPLFWVAALLCITGGLSSCGDQTSRQERLAVIPKHAWAHPYQPWVHLTITDSTIPYNIFVVIRHDQQFRYDNLLLRYGYIAPGDSVKYQEVNLPLAKNGRWLGDTLGTIVETRVRLYASPRRLPLGDNVFVMGHLMPDEPLAGVLQAGILVEAAGTEAPLTGADTGRQRFRHPVAADSIKQLRTRKKH